MKSKLFNRIEFSAEDPDYEQVAPKFQKYHIQFQTEVVICLNKSPCLKHISHIRWLKSLLCYANQLIHLVSINRVRILIRRSGSELYISFTFKKNSELQLNSWSRMQLNKNITYIDNQVCFALNSNLLKICFWSWGFLTGSNSVQVKSFKFTEYL